MLQLASPRGGVLAFAFLFAGSALADPATTDGSSPPSFLDEVVPLFTRLGCNAGACHGKLAGQNGFHLSLRGYAPDEDHLSLTREVFSRRINLAFPEESLLLRKPLGTLPHGGGRLIEEGSREHRLLHGWLVAGMAGLRADEPPLASIEILPKSRTLAPGEDVALAVRAHYKDGSARDVTWLSRFESNDSSVVEVHRSGSARVLRHGETTVRASFRTEVAVAVITAPRAAPVPPELLAARNGFIDDHVFAKLGALGIPPSDVCSDEAFIRRVFLDVLGKLPAPDEVKAFIADARPDRRARLIDHVLERPEHVDYATLQLADLFQNRKERDHDVRGSKGVRSFHAWLRGQVESNRPWNELVREVLTASGSSAGSPAIGYYVVAVGERPAEESEVVASVAQAVLGTRIGCAQCHNHPLERYTQDDYYHFAAFFSRMKLERKDPLEGDTRLIAATAESAARPPVARQPRTGRLLPPQPLDRSTVAVETGGDPRARLVEWMEGPGSRYLSGAMVNRTWKHLFGVGLVEPVDDLRDSNPPSNPALWNALVDEFRRSGYDRKEFLRLLLNSRAYQLSHETVPDNEPVPNNKTVPGNETDERFFSRHYVRRLPAEVLLDALAQCTGVPDSFPGYPQGVRAVQLPDPALKSYFLSLFGRSDRVTACACERSSEVTMAQLLHLQNSENLTRKLRAEDGRLTRLLASGTAWGTAAEELFLASLSRRPREAELAAVRREIESGAEPAEVLRDLFWAILNSKEFSFNH